MLNPILKITVKYRWTKRKPYYGKQQRTTRLSYSTVQASLSVGFGKNVKVTDKMTSNYKNCLLMY